jgi:hypothetical protein
MGIDAAFLSFRWKRRGDRGGGARLAGGSAVRAGRRCGRRKKVAGSAVQWAGPARRSRPSGGGEENRPVKKKKAGPKGRVGRK